MNNFIRIGLTLIVYLSGYAFALAQQTQLKIYLDCGDCDFSYFRRNLDIAEFVRAPQLADINVLVTSQQTAATGRLFFFNYTGRQNYSDINYRLKFVSETFYTEYQQREGLLKTLKLGLAPYLTVSPVPLSDVTLAIEKADPLSTEEDLLTMNPEDDQWNYWVFRLSGSGSISEQDQQSNLNLRTGVNADRITERFKLRSSFNYRINNEEFKDNGESIKSRISLTRYNIETIYSLSPKWSLGVFSGYNSSTFDNLKHATRISMGFEYNLFDWDRSDRKVLTISYLSGFRYNDYFETTIFNKKREFINLHRIRGDFVLRQRWGEIEARVNYSIFARDPSKYRLGFRSGSSIRLTKSISVFSEMEVESIHDQVFLPAEDLTREEILLRQKQLATNFQMSFFFGIEITFGSIYNNVVNPRF